jgi:general secretion pathway protein B
MSFILDALKKSESDRQRQSGPALFEVKVTPPRPRFPYWALALAALLVINIVVGGWVFLHRPAAEVAPAAQAAATPAVTAPPSATPPAVAAAPASHAAPVANLAPPSATPPLAATAPTTVAGHAEPVLTDSASKDAALNPDDYEPAVAPGKQDQEPRAGHVRSGTESGLVSYADAEANPDLHLPAMRIDLHVYAANPQERFVLINMHRLHEGDTLPEGVRVESITPEGAIVSYRGSKFFLEHQ